MIPATIIDEGILGSQLESLYHEGSTGPLMSTLRERNRERTRKDIIAAALALFVEQGYETTTVDQIAKAAGVSPATLFRYFPSKEDVLFGEEDSAAEAMVQRVAERADRSASLAALAEPVIKFAAELQDERTPRLTHLVMTTRSLEGRSLRMRLRWEREIARQLASEQELETPTLELSLTASIAVSCLSTALRYWDEANMTTSLADLVARAFDQLRDAPA